MKRYHYHHWGEKEKTLSFKMSSPINCEREICAIEIDSNADVFVDSLSIVQRILDNIIKEPHNEKYRTLRLQNKVVKEKLLSLKGVYQLLQKIGFVEVVK